MKLILVKDVKKVGKKDEVIEVKDGFGTFLINNKSAVLYTNKSKEILSNELAASKALEEKNIKEANKIKNQIEKIILEFPVKVGNNSKVFGSITTKQISEELKKKKFNIDKKQIKLNEDLNVLGVHNVNIELYKSVIAKLRVMLVEDDHGKGRTK